jgi:hypothetical protein
MFFSSVCRSRFATRRTSKKGTRLSSRRQHSTHSHGSTLITRCFLSSAVIARVAELTVALWNSVHRWDAHTCLTGCVLPPPPPPCSFHRLTCLLFVQMMQNLLLQEGDLVRIKNATLPKAKFVKLRPQSVAFLDIQNPRAV